MASGFSVFSLCSSGGLCLPVFRRKQLDWLACFTGKPMNIGYLVCLIALSCFPIEASAKTYKCMTEGGGYSFQDEPCEADFHDKSFDPVPGTVTPLPRIQIDHDALAYRAMDIADSEQAADSTGKRMLLFVALIVYLGLSVFQGWWAGMRNRSFWKWFFLATFISPLLTIPFFMLQRKDPASQKSAR